MYSAEKIPIDFMETLEASMNNNSMTALQTQSEKDRILLQRAMMHPTQT